jgi:hypothetical protein
MNYKLAYALGLHPWEDAEEQPAFTEKFTQLEKALERARERVEKSGVEMRLVQRDVTALRQAEVGSDFKLVLDQAGPLATLGRLDSRRRNRSNS